MTTSITSTRIAFTCAVGFCLALVAWWVYFLVREAGYLDEATRLLRQGKADAALTVLGARDGDDFGEKAQKLRVMFTAEGIAMGIVVLAGVVILYRATLRESRLRQEQERFLTGATHHLKTPLATIRLGIESMLAGSLPRDKHANYLNAMLREVSHLENDLTNLLTAGGLQARHAALRLVSGDLGEDVRSATDSMRDRYEAAGIRLDADIDPGVVVRRDAEAIHLVLHNLLDNAVKYSPRGSRVAVELRDAKDHASLQITDEGDGITAEDLPRVFDRFYRGHHSDHLGGTGIGLFLVRELVERHGGEVRAHSPGKGRGARFSIRLPIHRSLTGGHA